MAAIPEHIIDRIRDTVNVVDIVSRYVSLKKRGRNFIGLCPFHTEKTPSFNVNSEKQIFHCFGCGVGGNVYRFLMMHENIGFVDAVKLLSQETGVEIPTSPESRRQESESEQLYSANAVATQFFSYHLKHAPAQLREYLKGRGLNAESLERFQIGYAPPGWENLKTYLEKGNYHLAHYEKLGLLLKSEKSGRLYDRFRERLIFPIHSAAGKVVGFGGRQLDDDPKSPKYINSPESSVYQKSRVLYGLYFARDAIREAGHALFVEGYMDVIQLSQAGIANTVATSGTALTEDHARMIRRYTQQVVLCYDADSAGITAAARGGEVLFQNNVEVTVLLLPVGEDPDSYVRAHGKAAFVALLKTASEYLPFRLERIRERYDLERAGERSAAVSELLDILAPMQDAVRINFYLEAMAEALGLPVNILSSELLKKQRAIQRRERFGQIQQASEPDAGDPRFDGPPPAAPPPLILTGAWGGEKDVLLLLLSYYHDFHQFIFEHLAPEDFLNAEFRQVYSLIQSQPKDAGENLMHHILEQIENEAVRSLLVKEMFENNSEFQQPILYLQGCIKQIKIEGYRARIDLARRRLKDLPTTDPVYRETLVTMQEAMNALMTWQNMVPKEEDLDGDSGEGE